MKSGNPGVFISYAREDLLSAQKLEKILQAKGLRVWRDQESIYAGEQWPKAIGQAIENESIFLLIWSNLSAESHFVEFEWNTALALKKTIVPLLLDNTPLPAALRAINGISFADSGDAVKKLLELMVDSPGTGASAQQSKKWWEKRLVRLTFVILFVVLLTVVFEIPGKVKKAFREIVSEPQATCSLKGVVQNSRWMPVSGVVVKVNALPGHSVKSTGSGSFKFDKVPGRVGDSVRVTAYDNGRLVWDEYVTLPGPVTIKLEAP